MAHTAPTDDGYSRPITDLRAMFADDVLDHPDYYTGHPTPELLTQLRAALAGTPTVTIYRAAPPEEPDIPTGAWVTLSRDYAASHAAQDDDPTHDWPILTATVPTSTVYTDGNDLNECGYTGPAITRPDHA